MIQLDRTSEQRYIRILKGAIRMNDDATQKSLQEEITTKYGSGIFHSIQINVLEEIGQTKEI
jgi:hypothetical protein